jgi:RNA polymerase sigma-70 factor (ECF subfamily)
VEQYDSLTEERIGILYAQIKNLDTVEKGLILLYLEGKNYEEIANITGFTATNVGTRLSRIKQKLKSQIIK